MKPLYPISLVTCFLFSLILINGCISDSNLEGYPTVSFATEVQPIITANCTQSGCHGAVQTSEFSLLTYDEILQHVSPGNGRKSSIYRSITGRTIGNFMPEPPSLPLTENQIRSIYVWIEQGALNN